jgi:hypothetical protein
MFVIYRPIPDGWLLYGILKTNHRTTVRPKGGDLMNRHFFGLLFFLAVTATHTFVADALIIDHHHTDTQFIPDVWIAQVKNTMNIAYQHTSRGSQIVTGM